MSGISIDELIVMLKQLKNDGFENVKQSDPGYPICSNGFRNASINAVISKKWKPEPGKECYVICFDGSNEDGYYARTFIEYEKEYMNKVYNMNLLCETEEIAIEKVDKMILILKNRI